MNKWQQQRIMKYNVDLTFYMKFKDIVGFESELSELVNKYAIKFGLSKYEENYQDVIGRVGNYEVGKIFYNEKSKYYWIITRIDNYIIHGIRVKEKDFEDFKEKIQNDKILSWSLGFWNASYNNKGKLEYFWGHDSGKTKAEESEFTLIENLDEVSLVNIIQSFE